MIETAEAPEREAGLLEPPAAPPMRLWSNEYRNALIRTVEGNPLPEDELQEILDAVDLLPGDFATDLARFRRRKETADRLAEAQRREREELPLLAEKAQAAEPNPNRLLSSFATVGELVRAINEVRNPMTCVPHAQVAYEQARSDIRREIAQAKGMLQARPSVAQRIWDQIDYLGRRHSGAITTADERQKTETLIKLITRDLEQISKGEHTRTFYTNKSDPKRVRARLRDDLRQAKTRLQSLQREPDTDGMSVDEASRKAWESCWRWQNGRTALCREEEPRAWMRPSG